MPKLQPQIPTMIPPSAQPPRTSTPPLGQVMSTAVHAWEQNAIFLFLRCFKCFLLFIATATWPENQPTSNSGEATEDH